MTERSHPLVLGCDVVDFAQQPFLMARALRCCGHLCEGSCAGASSGDALISVSAVRLQPPMCIRNLEERSGILSSISRTHFSFSWGFSRRPFSLKYQVVLRVSASSFLLLSLFRSGLFAPRCSFSHALFYFGFQTVQRSALCR